MSYFAKRQQRKLRRARLRDIDAGTPLSYRGLTVPVTKGHMPLPVYSQIAEDAYEGPEIAAIQSLVRDGDRILELGTGLGIVSGLTSRMAKGLEIRSFEANPRLIEHIQKLHELNGITEVTVENALLEPEPEASHRPFHLHLYFPQGSIVSTEGSTETIDLPVKDFNAVMRDFRPDMFVCDIEGAEEFLFPKADLSGLRALVLELHPDMISRSAVKTIYDTCARHGLYPRIEYSSEQVVAFEKI
ncbi:hypothetical protein [Phaeobacter sp. HF9A]|uniref:hypothetical protein n=1 Tax=Phaeobacter sp. HF9A TaxID=2721561 RepID=UPI00142FFA3E|nr:hypothetical protein [Phaeobacter sp. HF9A]NIZ12946.1 hypothetical protein [Phaeobacter sp. HF9A]